MNMEFVKDFQWAVVRLATFQSKQRSPGKLLFATVSMLSPERPLPSRMEGADQMPLGKGKGNIFFRRTILKAEEALRWYRSLDESNATTPIPSKPEDQWEHDGCEIIVTNLIDDPQWPHLGLPMGEGLFALPSGNINPAPFLGNQAARVHRRFGNLEGFDAILDNEKAIVFIERRLHVDLKSYPEYLGSVALIVPDPIVEKIENFVIPEDETHRERIFYRIVPRAGQSLDDLKLTTFDEQSFLLTGFETLDIPEDGILVVDKGSCIGQYGYVLHHPVHGILAYHPACAFLRSIGFNMSMVHQKRKVSIPSSESPKSPQNEYTVHRVHHEHNNVVGDELETPNVNARIGTAARQREKAAFAEKFDQRWFGDGSREEAMAFIRTKVGRARKRILVADPYFGVLQVPQFLLAITSGDVAITILTSRLAFEKKFDPEDDGENVTAPTNNSLASKLQSFDQEIQRIKDAGNPNVDVLVLPGKSPSLHDRFLVVDDEVWFVGNSLNTLGSRASMIIKLPNPDVVTLELNKMLKQALTFETYRQQRLATERKKKS